MIVYIDVKSPYAFIALRPTLALEAELGMQFDWRPLTLNIPSYLGSAETKKGKVVASKGRSANTWNLVRYAYRDARRYAERQGHILKGTEKIWDSSIANIGILWTVQQARAQLTAYLNAVYLPFWRRELDIENLAVVTTCLQKAGVDTEGFKDFQQHEGRTLHDKLQEQFHANGIYGVPTYVFDGQILFGREHLPYIRWYLTGRTGAPPDIANSPNGSVPC
ncbi:MAG: DsbA family protein [Gammaproteobacteria bacterium]